MSDGRFEGRVAIVTGGASGIGLATVERFVDEGARVVVGDVNGDVLDAVAERLGEPVASAVCDVTSESDVEQMIETAFDRFGRLDIVHANAGIGGFAPLVDTTLDAWQSVMNVCLSGVFLTIKHAGRRMTDGGAIVATASLNAVQPAMGMAAYCAAKAGVAMLVQVAAMELGESGIRVNAVAPGLVRTPQNAAFWQLRGVVESFEENTALGRHAETEEIAQLVAFLASEDAKFITGGLYLIDGGAAMMRYPDLTRSLGGPRT